MMVCRNCGAEIDDKATSCPYCNADIILDSSTPEDEIECPE